MNVFILFFTVEPCELIKSKDDIPGIVIHPCIDQQDTFDNSHLKRKFIPTKRPADDFS